MFPRGRVRLLSIYAILSAITNFPSGFTNSTVNTAVEQLYKFITKSLTLRGYEETENMATILQSATLNCWFVAQIFGAMITPSITDRYGRKYGYLTCICVTIMASCVQYLSVIWYFPEGLIMGRALTALVSPLGDACLLLYVQETSPLEIRGMSSFLCEIGYGSMCVLGMILGMKSVLGYSLSKLLLLSLIPEFLSLIFLFNIPETPKFLMIVREEKEGALKSLEFFQGKSSTNRHILQDYMAEKSDDDRNQPSFSELFSKWHLRQAMALAIATLTLTLSFYPILQSSTFFLLYSGINIQTAQTMSTVAQVVLTMSSVFGASIIDRFPRRFLIIFFGILSNILLVSFAFFSHISASSTFASDFWPKIACLASLIAYCISFGMVLGPLSWFVAPELVSQRHRCTIFSACFAIHNLLIAITDFATIPLFKMFGGACFVFLFVVPSCFCMCYLYKYLPETQRRETCEIVSDMVSRARRDHFEPLCDTPSFAVRPRVFSISHDVSFY